MDRTDMDGFCGILALKSVKFRSICVIRVPFLPGDGVSYKRLLRLCSETLMTKVEAFGSSLPIVFVLFSGEPYNDENLTARQEVNFLSPGWDKNQ